MSCAVNRFESSTATDDKRAIEPAAGVKPLSEASWRSTVSCYDVVAEHSTPISSESSPYDDCRDEGLLPDGGELIVSQNVSVQLNSKPRTTSDFGVPQQIVNSEVRRQPYRRSSGPTFPTSAFNHNPGHFQDVKNNCVVGYPHTSNYSRCITDGEVQTHFTSAVGSLIPSIPFVSIGSHNGSSIQTVDNQNSQMSNCANSGSTVSVCNENVFAKKYRAKNNCLSTVAKMNYNTDRVPLKDSENSSTHRGRIDTVGTEAVVQLLAMPVKDNSLSTNQFTPEHMSTPMSLQSATSCSPVDLAVRCDTFSSTTLPQIATSQVQQLRLPATSVFSGFVASMPQVHRESSSSQTSDHCTTLNSVTTRSFSKASDNSDRRRRHLQYHPCNKQMNNTGFGGKMTTPNGSCGKIQGRRLSHPNESAGKPERKFRKIQMSAEQTTSFEERFNISEKKKKNIDSTRNRPATVIF